MDCRVLTAARLDPEGETPLTEALASFELPDLRERANGNAAGLDGIVPKPSFLTWT